MVLTTIVVRLIVYTLLNYLFSIVYFNLIICTYNKGFKPLVKPSASSCGSNDGIFSFTATINNALYVLVSCCLSTMLTREPTTCCRQDYATFKAISRGKFVGTSTKKC